METFQYVGTLAVVLQKSIDKGIELGHLLNLT
jgi:hypothetical protein